MAQGAKVVATEGRTPADQSKADSGTMREPQRAFGRTEVAIFLVALSLAAGAAWYLGFPAMRSREANVRASVADDLLAGLSRGRQGFIGSLAYPPLPTLVAVALVKLPPPLGGPWAAFWTQAMLGAFLAASVSAWLRICGVGATARLGAVLLLVASPVFLGWVSRGASEVCLLLVAFAGCSLLLHWLRTGHLRALAYLAIALGTGLAAWPQTIALLTVAFAVVVFRLARAARPRHHLEATVIVFLAPAVYIAALWTAANWLIMGEPFFFLRGLGSAQGAGERWRTICAEAAPWGPALALCAVAIVGRFAGAAKGRRSRVLLGLGTIAPCAIFFWLEGANALLPPHTPSDDELPSVIADCERNLSPAVLVVSGYRGYDVSRLLGDGQRISLYHTLSFYPSDMLSKTRGMRAYLLVPEPRGMDLWEDMHLRYPRIYEEPMPFTVYERSWKHWRLWRIVRLDRSDRR